MRAIPLYGGANRGNGQGGRIEGRARSDKYCCWHFVGRGCVFSERNVFLPGAATSLEFGTCQGHSDGVCSNRVRTTTIFSFPHAAPFPKCGSVSPASALSVLFCYSYVIVMGAWRSSSPPLAINSLLRTWIRVLCTKPHWCNKKVPQITQLLVAIAHFVAGGTRRREGGRSVGGRYGLR